MNKRIAVVAFVAAAFAGLATPSWAFQSVSITTITAGTTTGGVKVAAFSLSIRDNNNPFGANQSSITWSGASPTSGWKIADRFVLLNSTVTDAKGGVRIYTDNTHPAAVPRYVDPTPLIGNNLDSDPSGLVRVPPTGSTSTAKLNLAWAVKGSTQTVGTSLIAADPNTGPSTGPGNKFQWLFMLDKASPPIDTDGNGTNDTSGFSADASNPFSTIVNDIGIHGAQGPSDFFTHPDGANAFVYLQADFSASSAQQAYQTNALRVEAFIE